MVKAIKRSILAGALVVAMITALGLASVVTSPARALGQQGSISSALKPSFAAYGFWGVNASEALQAYPGASYMPLTVVLVYLGPITIYNVTVRPIIGAPFEYVKGEGVPELYVPVLQPGTSLRLEALLNVSPTAADGVYNESLNVTYTALVQEPIVNITVPIRTWDLVSFGVPVTGYSVISLVGYYTKPAVVYSGLNASELTVYLVNEGTSVASNVTVTLVGSGPIRPLTPGLSTIRVGYMPPGRVINLTFLLGLSNVSKTISLSQYGVNVVVPEAYNATVTLLVTARGLNETIEVPLEVYPRAYFAIARTYHTTLTAGSSDTYITVTIVNVGGSEAKYVVASLLPNPVVTPYISSSENPVLALTAFNYTVGDVPNLETANLTFVVSVSSGIPSGTYYVPIMLTWYQPPTMQVMHQIVLVPITVSPSFSLRLPSLSSGNLVLIAVAVLVIVILVVMALVGSRSRSR